MRPCPLAGLILAAACGGTTEPTPPPPPPPSVVTSVSVTATPNAGLAGDSATITCSATTSDGSAANVTTDYLGQTGPRVELRTHGTAYCTATRGTSLRSAGTPITVTPLVPTIAAPTLRAGETGAVTLDATPGVDSVVLTANGTRVGRVDGNAGSLAWTPSTDGEYALDATAHNNAATARAETRATVLPPLRRVRIRALDVETDPALGLDTTRALPALRYDLAVNGRRVNLPADTTILVADGDTITVPGANTVEQLVGLYRGDRMVGVLDAFGNRYVHRGGDATLRADVMLRDKLTPEERHAGVFVYTNIAANHLTGELLSDRGTLRPVLLDTMDYWVRTSPRTVNGFLQCEAMPAHLFPAFVAARDDLQELEKDKFGRSLVHFRLRQGDFPDSLYVDREYLIGSNLVANLAARGNVVNCYADGAADQGTAYGTHPGTDIKVLDAFSTRNGSGESSVGELLDLAGRVVQGREWPRNNGLTIFEQARQVTTYTRLDQRWRAGPTRIATEAGRELGVLPSLPRNE